MPSAFFGSSYYFQEEDMLGLFSPLRLIGMGMGLRTTILPSLEDRIVEITARGRPDRCCEIITVVTMISLQRVC
ncbi:hypothetical protein WSK_0764 [Novosphingobium sp. Rr 2-17]|nr:hypothetical protein WSK_0764 [Novosphingobium sp. Rr 2-17]